MREGAKWARQWDVEVGENVVGEAASVFVGGQLV